MKTRLVLSLAVLLAVGVTLGAQRTPSRRHIVIAGADARLPFSNGVLAGNTLYLAGVLGVDADGRIPEDLDKEIRNALERIKAVLAEGGMTMDDLVTVQVFCPDLSLYGKFNDIYRSYFTKEMPARAFIGSGPLLRGAHFEVQGIAVKRN